MSDFAISQKQRDQLLAGDYRPLVFDTKPHGLEPGAVYVLARGTVRTVREDGKKVNVPGVPVWFITVTKVLGGPQRLWERRDGRWLARFDMVDRRHPERYMRRFPLMPELAEGEQDYTSSPRSAVDKLPVPEWTPHMVNRAKAIGEFWHAERLKRHAEEQRERGRERSKARRKRAA